MSKNGRSRGTTERDEGLPTVSAEVPATKFQPEQQVANAAAAQDTRPAESSFQAKDHQIKGSQLKQQVISDVVTGTSHAAGMGINAAGRSVSGTGGGVLGAANSTPVAGRSRSDSRLGKKFDRLATKLNFTPAEQFFIDVDESKPLADAADADQGYNGTYRNENARSQKIHGAVPGDLLFARSVDYIFKDKLYFVEGQQVYQTALDRTAVNPGLSVYGESYGDSHAVVYTSGNYLHQNFHFGLNPNGKVRYFFADVIDLTPSDVVDPEIANVSSAARIIKEHVAELDRQVMDSKAGDEKGELWTPLARAVLEPTCTSYLMSSIEADTGAYVALAYAKATTNFSYQLNRGPKDGLTDQNPAIEECVGWRFESGVSTGSGSAAAKYSYDLKKVFKPVGVGDPNPYDLGDPTLMIEAYDSINKYNNKADLLLQARGWRMHLQTADNNMNPLRIPSQLVAVFNGQECFSTIDHEYDPMLPICVTDKANLVTVHNFNELCAFIHDQYKITIAATAIASDYKYKSVILVPLGAVKALGYDNLYIHYKKTAGDGLEDMTAGGVITFDADSSNAKRVLDIIITPNSSEDGFTTIGTVPANFAYDVVIHVPVVQNETNTKITKADWIELDHKLFFYNAGPFSYSYSDLRNNYIVDVQHPLIDGLIAYLENAIGSKFYTLLGARKELFVPLIFSTQYMTLAQLLFCAATPWIARVRVNAMRDVIYYEENVGQYPFQKLISLKDAPFHNYVNFTFSGYDEPLQTKVMMPTVAVQWVMPEFIWKIDTYKYVLPWYFSENELKADGSLDLDASAMSFPSIRSGVRLGMLDSLYGMSEKDVRLSLDRMTKWLLTAHTPTDVGAYKYGRTTDGQPYVVLNSEVISIKDVLMCPRELGLCMDAPAGVLTPKPVAGLSDDLSDEVGSSFRIKVYVNNNTLKEPVPLSADGVNINRAANYTQKWFQLFADVATSDTVIAGLVFGMNDEGAAEFKPFAALGTGVAKGNSAPTTLVSLQRSMWTRLQMLPFIISPFDGHATGAGTIRDIYDIAYMFGLCGFRASDYRESVYNREKEVINQGLLFVEDPWVLDSPIVKNGATSTGAPVGRGYELARK